MQIIEHELQIRKDEVDSVYQFLASLENGTITSPPGIANMLTVKTSVKAGILLMLYNAVESTMTNCLSRIHKEMIDAQIKFSDCNSNIQKMLIVYYENILQKNSDNSKRAEHILNLLHLLNGSDTFNVSYGDLEKFYSLYSGNLDSREILAVMEKYGASFSERISELKTIKDFRNQLAHGVHSFEEVGREISLPQLGVMKDRTFEYLTKVVNAVKVFISDKKYMGTESPN